MAPREEVSLREATRADLLSVFRIEKRTFEQPWPYAAFERFVGEPGFLVAEREGEIVGYAVADSVPNHGTPLGHLKDIAVDPDHRGEGIGRLLLAESLTRLLARGVSRVKLEVRESNERARSLYETFGFEIHHVMQGYYDDGEDAYVMVREV